MIFKHLNVFEYICEYCLKIIFFFIFMRQNVKKNIHFCIYRICLLQILFIFVFVHQKDYLLHSVLYLSFSRKFLQTIVPH